jgi:hypothetical protein
MRTTDYVSIVVLEQPVPIATVVMNVQLMSASIVLPITELTIIHYNYAVCDLEI